VRDTGGNWRIDTQDTANAAFFSALAGGLHENVERLRATGGRAEAGKTPVLEVRADGADGGGFVDPAAAGGQAAQKKVSDPIVIRNPAGFHARPAAVLVNSAKQFAADIRLNKNGKEANAKSVVSIMGLEVENSDSITVSATGPDADAALAKLVPLILSGLGESLSGAPVKKAVAPPAAPPRPKSDNPNVILGVSASPGIVTGQVFKLTADDIRVEEKGKGSDAEKTALLDAVNAGRKQLDYLQEELRRKGDKGRAAIFTAHTELLEDPELLDLTLKGIAEGRSAAFAWKASYTAQAESLSKLGNELLAGRANDIRDVGRRVLALITGEEAKAPDVPANAILIAENLTPSDTAGLDKTKVLGFATVGGSATSHVAILARSASLPAIAAVEERALDIPDNTTIILDGTKGEIRLNPSREDIERIAKIQTELSVRRKVELADAHKPATTTDGRNVKVVGNIGGAADAEEIPDLGGEGVGLLRSEFLFLQRETAPTLEEQAAVYTTVAKTLGAERDLVVRTLDVGGDKPLSYFPLPPEENPFLGVRGIRLNLVDENLLATQARAVLAAAPFTRLHIMFPMVATVEELRAARAVVLREKEALGVSAPVHIGIMIEVPSAAVLAEGLAKEADFFSIGTNDLTQYTLAVDRGNPRLAKMADGLHPAVLNLIAKTVEGAHKHGKWAGVCGGLASELEAVPVLVGLGVDELSVAVSAIPAIKAAVRRQSMTACRALANRALTALTAPEVRAMVGEFLSENK
jgi:phosphocarrier protein FPr